VVSTGSFMSYYSEDIPHHEFHMLNGALENPCHIRPNTLVIRRLHISD
jgi:hypothetical protein